MDIKKLEEYIGFDIQKLTEKYRGTGYHSITEIRLHPENYITVSSGSENMLSDIYIDREKFGYIISELCRRSLHTYENTIREGYIELGDGFRAGVCGNAVFGRDGSGGSSFFTVSEITAVSIRLPHRIENAADGLYSHIIKNDSDNGSRRIHSCLIYSPPGTGKTTLLRELAVKLSGGAFKPGNNFARNDTESAKPLRVALIDSRCEMKTDYIAACPFIDIYSGYPKADGIEAATRTMSPQVIICDEIGGYDEAVAILSAQNTGVPLIASAHASELSELLSRRNIRILHDCGIFELYAGLMPYYGRAGYDIAVSRRGDEVFKYSLNAERTET